MLAGCDAGEPDSPLHTYTCPQAGEVARFDVGPHSYAVYHAEDDGKFYATAGKCTHGIGMLTDGTLRECSTQGLCFSNVET
jgi:nitrite reductase/ring-hydroxylating ferredoxin subunit